MLLLQEFDFKIDFKIIHRPGKKHFGTDFLSRAAPATSEEPVNDELPDAQLFRIEIDSDGSEIADVEREWLDINKSANKLEALGKALLIYANDHEDKYPDTLQSIEGYLDDLQWFTENDKYSGKGKTLTEPPFETIAYDKTLLEKGVRTNVLQNDL